MKIADFLPFQQAPQKTPVRKVAQPLSAVDRSAMVRVFKVGALALGFNGLVSNLSQKSTYERPEHDFDRIIQAVDTDSYAREAFAKYRELMWKEGWELVGESSEAVNYLWQRIDFFEIAMRRTFNDFLTEAADQLLKFSNVFIVKSRSEELRKFFPGKLDTREDNKPPIVGYYFIPAERVEILRDRYNKPRWYRQRLTDSLLSNGPVKIPTWKAEEVIHLTWDRRPGRIFGTPLLVSVMDDIVALRQIEEDIQNLIHRELFPLYKYMVGTDDHPANQDEIDKAVLELENLRTEGGLVLPHRHNVEVIGSDGNALDASEYLPHFKERVAIGLGLYPHHLGMVTGSNRDATDRLDTALYDKVKTFQRYIADAIRMNIFDEILLEGGFNPYVSPKIDGISERCVFKFSEIDVDTQIKKETHVIQKFTSNLESQKEARYELNLDPDIDENDTLMALTARMAPVQPVQTKTADGKPGAPKLVDTTPAAAIKPDAQNPSKGVLANPKNIKKGPNNIVRPINQFGRRTSPNIRRSDIDDEVLTEIVEILGDEYSG